MKDVFIVNPKSGKNSQYELIKEIKEHFQGKRIIIEKTKGPEHATFIAKKYALSDEPVHLFVCGGDGTLHEVTRKKNPPPFWFDLNVTMDRSDLEWRILQQ